MEIRPKCLQRIPLEEVKVSEQDISIPAICILSYRSSHCFWSQRSERHYTWDIHAGKQMKLYGYIGEEYKNNIRIEDLEYGCDGKRRDWEVFFWLSLLLLCCGICDTQFDIFSGRLVWLCVWPWSFLVIPSLISLVEVWFG